MELKKNLILYINDKLCILTFSSDTSRDFKLLPTTRSSSSSSTILLLNKKFLNNQIEKYYLCIFTKKLQPIFGEKKKIV